MPEPRAAEASSVRSTRILLGVGAVGLGVAAVGFWMADAPGGAGVLARSAAVLGALWVAFPVLAELRWQAVVAGLGVLAVFAYRPRSGWIVAVVAAAALSMSKRRSQRGRT